MDIDTIINFLDAFKCGVNFHTQAEFEEFDNSLFGKPNYKELLEEQFNVDLTI